MVFGLNLAWCLTVNSIPHDGSVEGSFITESFRCTRQQRLFLEQWKQKHHHRQRHVAAWYHTNGSVCDGQPHLLTGMPHINECQVTASLVLSHAIPMLQRQTERKFPIHHNKRNFTSLPSSTPVSSFSTVTSSQNAGARHVEHDRPPALQTADTGTRLLHPNDYMTMILEQHHFQQQRDTNILWLRDDEDCVDDSLSGGDVNAWDVVLLLVFLFFGLNAALNLQQQSRMHPVAITRRSWCNFIPRRPNHKQQQQQQDDLQDPSYETECPCCCEAYDISPSWNKYNDGAAVRLPILSQACIHSYCLQCARQDRERLVQLTIMSATAMEQSCPFFFFLASSSTTYNTSIRCPFCRQPNAFDIQNPILRPDAYDAYINEQMAQGQE